MAKIKSINIKGGKYAMVHDRVNYFRENYPNHCIETKITHFDHDKGYVVVRCVITGPEETGIRNVIASGLAHEFRDDRKSMVNKTSFVENAETSAIGRALACLGIGTEDAYASAEEVNMASEKGDEETGASDISADKSSVGVADEPPAVTPETSSQSKWKKTPKSLGDLGGKYLEDLNLDQLDQLEKKASSKYWQDAIKAQKSIIAGEMEKADLAWG